ncbi:MAG: PLDc_N domain-containing protein [Alphaproteobacteria bacterium]|nr:PLDc_N domain-containing protein [Alphaproteobacteria bacterium]MCB9794471.1 PLDc_N domain-containing protein [Alphaproteobacteria bacterium]
MESFNATTLLLLAPIVLLDLSLKLVALVQLNKAERVRFDSKLVWVGIILLVSPFGWIAWFLAGREDP